MNTNQQLFEQSLALIPGGVNSPVRAFRSVGGTPVFFERAQGDTLWDVEGKAYIDYINSWGASIVGHAHEMVVNSVKKTLADGFSFGAPSSLELAMARLISQCVPSIEQVRLVSSGTEATMSAIRLARGYTGRDKIVKFEGCYHGHADSLLVKAGSGLLTLGTPSSAGVPKGIAALTLTIEYNNVPNVHALFDAMGDEIAAVIVEPIAGNMNLILPSPEFLHALRARCTQHGTVLIFDEVMSGFRVHLGGAQALYAVSPDLTTLGKVIGGGLPVGALGGRRDIMQHMAPQGDVYQAGTLSGNPVALSAGLQTLALVQAVDFYPKLAAKTALLTQGLLAAAQNTGIAFSAQSVGGMFGIYFQAQVPTTFNAVNASNPTLFKRFFHGMLQRGFYFAPSAFEAGFISSAHSETNINNTLIAAQEVFATLKDA